MQQHTSGGKYTDLKVYNSSVNAVLFLLIWLGAWLALKNFQKNWLLENAGFTDT